jgi:hypothetical protein
VCVCIYVYICMYPVPPVRDRLGSWDLCQAHVSICIREPAHAHTHTRRVGLQAPSSPRASVVTAAPSLVTQDVAAVVAPATTAVPATAVPATAVPASAAALPVACIDQSTMCELWAAHTACDGYLMSYCARSCAPACSGQAATVAPLLLTLASAPNATAALPSPPTVSSAALASSSPAVDPSSSLVGPSGTAAPTLSRITVRPFAAHGASVGFSCGRAQTGGS